MKNIIVVLIITYTIMGAASTEFPICTAPGEQFYPDVCWDGSEFWVVWQDDSLGTIRGIRVSEEGDLIGEEVEFLEKGSDPGPVRYPCVAAGPDRIAVEARVMAGYNEFLTELWGVMHNEFTFDGEPLYPEPARFPESFNLGSPLGNPSTPIVLFGKEHFFSFLMIENETPVDVHSANYAITLDSGGWYRGYVWQSSEIRFEALPPVACWGGEKFFLVFYDELDDQKNKGVFIEDTFAWQGIGGQFDLDRAGFDANYGNSIKNRALLRGGSKFLIVGETGWYSANLKTQMWFDVLGSDGMPIKDSATILNFSPTIEAFYPDAIYNGENYVCVWENRSETEGIDLYSIKVDTLGSVIDSGYIVSSVEIAQHPALASGRTKVLITWSDNRDGDNNIYGMLQDAEGIEEDNPPFAGSSTIIAQPIIFSNSTRLYLPNNMERDITLKVYDNTGSLVRRLVLPRGERSVVWDGNDARGQALHPGVYFVMPEGVKVKPARIVKL